MSKARTPRLALLCDRAGLIQNILCDDFFTDGTLLRGQVFAECVDPGSRDKVSHLLAEVNAQGSAFDWELNLASQGKLVTLHFSAFAIDASLLIVGDHIRNDILQIQEESMRKSNELVNILRAAIKDQIAREQAEEALKRARTEYQTLVENISDVIFSMDLNGNFLYISPVIKRISGYSSDELIGVPFTKFVHPDDLLEVVNSFKQTLAGIRAAHEFRAIDKDGNIHWVHSSSNIDLENGKIRAVTGLMTDITERKQAEQALQESHDLLEQRVQQRTTELSAANLDLEKAARMKDEFLAAMSHELRTPLTGILGLSEVMQMPSTSHDPLTEEQRTHLTLIHSSGQHLLEMVNDILDFSSIGAGKFVLNLAPCSLEEICQACLRKGSAQSAAKGLRSSFSITPDSILLKADRRRLYQILSNLQSNAIKFTPQGGSFGIQVLGDPSEKQVRIIVWDTGIGIQQEDIERLFQPFIQLDASLERRYNGTGLGLALVRKLTELHGGSISVESKFGSGSRFTVSLPWISP